jgi:hypothetical protein
VTDVELASVLIDRVDEHRAGPDRLRGSERAGHRVAQQPCPDPAASEYSSFGGSGGAADTTAV